MKELIAIGIFMLALYALYVAIPKVIYVYVAIIIFILIALFFKFFVKKYDEYERAVIFRFGRFNRIAGPGWAIVIPFIEKEFARIDARMHMLEINFPKVFTSDDLQLQIDGFAYYRVVDPSKAVLRVDDYLRALRNLIASETRNVIGSMSFREVISNLDELNDILADRIRRLSWKWGIDVDQVQLREVSLPTDVIEALKAKTISEANLQAQRFRAEARRVVIEAIGEAAKSLDDRALMYLYLKALEKLGEGKATKIIFPARFYTVLQDMEKDVGKALAGLNVTSLINAIANKLQG